MNASPNLTFKQQRFVEEYQVDGNGSQAVLRAGYKTKHPAEMAYGLLRHPEVKHSLQDAQNARRERQLRLSHWAFSWSGPQSVNPDQRCLHRSWSPHWPGQRRRCWDRESDTDVN